MTLRICCAILLKDGFITLLHEKTEKVRLYGALTERKGQYARNFFDSPYWHLRGGAGRQPGRAYLEGYEGRGKDKTKVTDELIDRAIEMGFLSEGGQISFSIDSPDEALFQKYGEELKEEVNRHLKDRFSITIEIIDPHTGESETTAVENPVQEESQPEPQTETGAPTTSQPETAAPQTSGDSDYDPGSDGVTEYSQPEPQPVQPAAPVYSEEGESDYDEENEDEGESDYEEDEEDD